MEKCEKLLCPNIINGLCCYPRKGYIRACNGSDDAVELIKVKLRRDCLLAKGEKIEAVRKCDDHCSFKEACVSDIVIRNTLLEFAEGEI